MKEKVAFSFSVISLGSVRRTTIFIPLLFKKMLLKGKKFESDKAFCIIAPND